MKRDITLGQALMTAQTDVAGSGFNTVRLQIALGGSKDATDKETRFLRMLAAAWLDAPNPDERRLVCNAMSGALRQRGLISTAAGEVPQAPLDVLSAQDAKAADLWARVNIEGVAAWRLSHGVPADVVASDLQDLAKSVQAGRAAGHA